MINYRLNKRRRRLQVLSRCGEKGNRRRHTRTSATMSSLQSPLQERSLISCPRPTLKQLPPNPSFSPLLPSSVRFVMLSKATRPQSHITWKAISLERRGGGTNERQPILTATRGSSQPQKILIDLQQPATNVPRPLSIKPDDYTLQASGITHCGVRHTQAWPLLCRRVTEACSS